MSLHHKVINGATWRVIGRVSSQAAQFAMAVVLARLLTPDEYGLIAMATVFLAFAGSFSEFGFGVALIQRKELNDEHPNSAFWVNMGVGVLLFALFSLASPWIADFYSEPQLESIVPVLALPFLFEPLGMVQRSMLHRSMNFRSLAVVELATAASSGAIGIVLAVNGYGVWSLVVSAVLSRAINIGISWWYIKWLPRWGFSQIALRELFGFSGNFTLYGVIDYLGKSLDRLLIGRFMGAHDVGIYNRAYAIMMAPFTQIVWVVASVLFPALSSIQEDKERVGRIFLRSISLVTFISMPALLGLIVVADPFVRVLFGAQWLEAIPILQIFCLLGLAEIIKNMIGAVIESQGDSAGLVRYSTAQSVLNMVAISLGVVTGSLPAIALSVVLANYIVLGMYLNGLRKLVGLHYRQVVNAIGGAMICALLMAMAVYLFNQALPDSTVDITRLSLCVVLGVTVYGLLALTVRPSGWLELKTMLAAKMHTLRMT